MSELKELLCETCGKPVGRMWCQICADCCEKDHPEINHLASEVMDKALDNYEYAHQYLYRAINGTLEKQVYHQDMPNGNHFGSMRMLSDAVNGLMRNVIGTINLNTDRAWGKIPVMDGYLYEKLGKILYELKIDIDNPDVRKRLKY